MTDADLTSRSTLTLLAAFGLLVALFSYGFRLVRVQGPSMEPTFRNGEFLLMRRWNWPSTPPQYGDVVIFRMGHSFLVKRVAGMPGDPAPIDEDDSAPATSLRSTCASPSPNSGSETPPRVPLGYLYVLGDNSNNSDDSRDFGPIPGASVIGRVIEWNVPRPPVRPLVAYAAAGR